MPSDLPTSIDELHRRWEERDETWSVEDSTYVAFGRKALEFGHPSLAVDVLKEGLSVFPDNSEMIFRSALALARGGATRAAERTLAPLLGELSDTDPLCSEILGLAGRLCKDRYQKLELPSERRAACEQSAGHYGRAFEATGEYFPGINAATMTCLSGELDRGRKLASDVRVICLAELDAGGEGDYWLLATLAEASLLLGESTQATTWYGRATEAADQRFGDIASMRRQVRMLRECLDVPPEVLQALKIPTIVTFSGHMIDHPGRLPARFPAEIEQRVTAVIRDALDRIEAEIGYCSAACGADVLFIETMLARKAEVHVVLPFKKDDFIRTSVAFAGEQWVQRFEDLLGKVTSVTYATEEGHLGDDILFEYTGDLINGMALLRGEQLDSAPMLLALMDPGVAGRVGGTAGNVNRWRSGDHALEVIDVERIRHETGVATNTTSPDSPPAPHEDAQSDAKKSPRAIRAMLFADMVGFSKVGEEEAPTFFIEFLGQISSVIRDSVHKPSFCNTWGDGLYMVFDTVASAADFALRLRDIVVNKDWVGVGLPKHTNIRIGVHTGPVYRGRDPIIDKVNYFGSHVNRAARIEPVTTPGSVFVSEQTACLLAVEDQKEFTCDYLGVMELAKGYGRGALYRLRRASEAE